MRLFGCNRLIHGMWCIWALVWEWITDITVVSKGLCAIYFKLELLDRENSSLDISKLFQLFFLIMRGNINVEAGNSRAGKKYLFGSQSNEAQWKLIGCLLLWLETQTKCASGTDTESHPNYIFRSSVKTRIVHLQTCHYTCLSFDCLCCNLNLKQYIWGDRFHNCCDGNFFCEHRIKRRSVNVQNPDTV